MVITTVYIADCLVISDSQFRSCDKEISLPPLLAEFTHCWRKCEVQIPKLSLFCMYSQTCPIARIQHSILCILSFSNYY